MRQENTINWYAEEGKTFRRKVDGFIMGPGMQLGDFIDGTVDTIDNYEEIDDPDYEARNAEKNKRLEEMENRRKEMEERRAKRMAEMEARNQELKSKTEVVETVEPVEE